MTPEHKQRILDAIWGDCYTNVHAEVIFKNDGRLAKIERIERIVMKARLDAELLQALCDWQESEQARINAQEDTE
jgi:hypothetical protein